MVGIYWGGGRFLIKIKMTFKKGFLFFILCGCVHMRAGNHDQQRPEALHPSRAGVTAGELLDVGAGS